MSISGGCQELYSIKGLAAAIFLVVSLVVLHHAYIKEGACSGLQGECCCPGKFEDFSSKRGMSSAGSQLVIPKAEYFGNGPKSIGGFGVPTAKQSVQMFRAGPSSTGSFQIRNQEGCCGGRSEGLQSQPNPADIARDGVLSAVAMGL